MRRVGDRLEVGLDTPRDPLPDHERERLVHELQIHQIELEMQNEELRQARNEMELTRDKFTELYDFAPVSYFTFDASGIIQEVNLSGAILMGMERQLLINRPFSAFIPEETHRQVFEEHLKLVLHSDAMLRCEIGFTSNDGVPLFGRFHSVPLTDSTGTICILTSLVDTTVRKQLEDKLLQSHSMLESLVEERTQELSSANLKLLSEIDERKVAENTLRNAYLEISRLKELLQAENVVLQQEVAAQYNFGELIGQSPALSNVFLRVEQVAPMNATVLLLGETGTGKGMIARAIHSRSTRKDRMMITVNCTSLPANLIESELFGRERGAFTGAHAKQIGRFELADGGTIFLDEIGEMPLELQSKLLRAIQDGEFERLGSPRTVKVNVRIIAASNRNLKEEIKKGKFREDLYYRLNVFPIMIPPLRHRAEDIPLLVKHFLAKFNKKNGKSIKSVSNTTMKALKEYNWPGNVRELESVIERAVITTQGSELKVLDHFDPLEITAESSGHDIKEIAELEHDHILQVLQKTGWRIEGEKGAAVLLGLNASTLRARMRKYGIVRK